MDEEQQVKDYLKRAEIRTMKKDLQKLREVDALKERDKIANLKTTEGLQIPKKPPQDEGIKRVLEHGVIKEREAEKDLKRYASEPEKQQIFLLESERIKLQNEIKDIETKKEPDLLLRKNEILLEQKKAEVKLGLVSEEEKKRENEQKYIEEKEKESAVPSEKKALEERRSELESQRQEVEKKRWAVEKELSEINEKIKNSDYDFEIISAQKNKAQSRIAEIDSSLRTIYSGVISREEEKRQGQEAGQKLRRQELAKSGAERKEQIQREQWLGLPPKKQNPYKKEYEQREQFLKNINESQNE